MKTSITKENKYNKLKYALSFMFWICVWQLLCQSLGQEMLLASPVSVFMRLKELVFETSFWLCVMSSFCNVIGGFFAGLFIAFLLACLAYRFSLAETLLKPLLSVVKATPVASYAILLLLFLSSKSLAACVSGLMVLPVIYGNVLTGLKNTDSKLLEMAEVFHLSAYKKIRYVYFSQVLPFFVSACSVSLGICWKAGIAAEVIGIPKGSIGERLYSAKIYLDSEGLFAWTFVVILFSIIFENMFLSMLKYLSYKAERAL